MNLKWVKLAAIRNAWLLSAACGTFAFIANAQAKPPEPARSSIDAPGQSDKPDDKAEDKEQTDAKDEAKAEKSADEALSEQLIKQMKFDWKSISASATQNLKQAFSERTIAISGEIKVLNDQDLIGLSQQAELTSAIDENGKELVAAAPAQPPGPIAGLFRGRVNPNAQPRWYQFPDRQPQQAPWFGAIQPVHTNVSINLNQNAIPKKLASVKGILMVLAGKTMPSVDLAASASEDWTDLGKELSIRLSKAEQQKGTIQYQLESKGDEANRNFNGWVGPQQPPLPKTIITKVSCVDESKQVHDIQTGSAFNPNSGGSAGFGNVGRITIMRFTYATDVHEVAVPFEIKDLDMPAFE